MVSLLSKSAPGSPSFLWTFPECPVRIHVNFQFIERLQSVLNLTPANREVGGLLIGKELSLYGDIEVCNYFQLPPGPESSKNFAVWSESLDEAIQSASAAQGRVIGFYRTHLEQRIQLRPEDLECIRSKFKNPMNIFLVIRPHDRRASAGFFFWQDGSVVGGLTFPFSTVDLKSGSWTSLVGGPAKESRPRGTLARAGGAAVRKSTGILASLLIVVLVLAALAAFQINQPVTEAPQPQPLGLRVERAALGVVVSWNPAVPEITAAKDADLLIWDGSSPPAFVRLTTVQLRSGKRFFTSVSDRVEVRLDIIGAAGKARTESIVSVSRAPDSGPPVAPAAAANTVVRARQASPATLPEKSQKPGLQP